GHRARIGSRTRQLRGCERQGGALVPVDSRTAVRARQGPACKDDGEHRSRAEALSRNRCGPRRRGVRSPRRQSPARPLLAKRQPRVRIDLERQRGGEGRFDDGSVEGAGKGNPVENVAMLTRRDLTIALLASATTVAAMATPSARTDILGSRVFDWNDLKVET